MRRAGIGDLFGKIVISIHAPARGATTAFLKSGFSPNLFQSTHPHGVRLVYIISLHSFLCISIHAPARGATTGYYEGYQAGYISIHAPARGAT